MIFHSLRYRLITAALFLGALWIGQDESDTAKWICWVVSTASGACFQLSFTLNRDR